MTKTAARSVARAVEVIYTATEVIYTATGSFSMDRVAKNFDLSKKEPRQKFTQYVSDLTGQGVITTRGGQTFDFSKKESRQQFDRYLSALKAG